MSPQLVHAAIKALVPGAQYSLQCDGTTYAILQWIGPGQQPTNQDIDAQIASMQAAFDADVAAKAARIQTDIAEAASAKIDSQVMTFLDMTPAQRANWVTNNVSGAGLTLAQVKAGLDTALNVLGAIASHGGRGRNLRNGS